MSTFESNYDNDMPDAEIAAHAREHMQRVVVDRNLRAEPPDVAEKRHGVTADVAFVRREDGWVLGAPRHLAGVAKSLWRGKWACRVDIRTGRVDHFPPGQRHSSARTAGRYRRKESP